MSERKSGADPWLRRAFREGWRRKALQSAAAYAVTAWLIVEVASLVLDAFEAPAGVLQVVIILAVAGFPVAIIVSWLFDVTPEGLVRTGTRSPDPADAAPADGESVEGVEGASPRDGEPKQPPDSTRRHLTVLCASIEVSGRELTDPEELLEQQKRLDLLFTKVCERFGGYVLSGGTGVLNAWFGYPAATEDAARNAVRAALGLVDGVARSTAGDEVPDDTETPCRVAVHSGDVIIEEGGDSAEDSPKVVGLVPREALKLLECGSPGEALISEEVYRSVRRLFELEMVDENAERPVYRVLYESRARTRLAALQREDMLPLAGRDAELQQLRQHWERACNNQGQAVLVSGSGGIGKSRLVHELKLMVGEDPRAWMIEFQCEPMHTESALHPVISFYREQILDVSESDGDPDDLAKVEGFLAEYNQDLTTTVPVFADLLGIEFQQRYQPTGFAPQKQRKIVLELLIDLMTQRASRQPLLLSMENLHFADPSSIELMGMLIEQAPALSMLCVLTLRTPFELPWAMSSHLSQINLAGLEPAAVESVCQSISSSLPAQVVESIAAKADGVPLFIEEVTRSLVESGAFDRELEEAQLKELIETLIPSTLKDALSARLDSLGNAMGTAQLGATLGRHFSHRLITEVAAQMESPDVEARLDELIAPEIIHRVGAGSNLGYRFKHALIQDAAYQSMLKRKRKAIHRVICDVLEEQFADLVEQHPEVLAYHYEGAEIYDQAIRSLMRAANKAMLAAATAEAIAALCRGLRLAQKLPEGEQRTLLELELQTALGSASMFAFGYASEQAHNAYTRAESLLAENIPPQYAVPVVMGLSAYHSVRGAAVEGQRHNSRILELAEFTGDADLALWAHAFLCVGDFYEGKFAGARGHMDVVESLYDFERHRGLCVHTSQDPMVFALVHCSQSLWALGEPDRAAEMARRQDELAHTLGHPLVLQQALGWGNMVSLYRGEAQRLLEKASHAHRLAEEQGLTFYMGGNKVWWGAALSQLGDPSEGLELMREGMALLSATGAEIGKPMMLALVAEALGSLGEAEQGLKELDTALERIELWGECFYLAECHRLRGELYARLDRPAEARACYERSLTVARKQEALSFELRTAISQARLDDPDRAPEQSLEALREIFGKFSEGRDTADHRTAAALLAGMPS